MKTNREKRQILNRYSWFPVDKYGIIIQEKDRFEVMSGLKKSFKTLTEGICNIFIYEEHIEVNIKDQDMRFNKGDSLKEEMDSELKELIPETYIDETIFVSDALSD